jgi:hypothetical protein
MTIQEISSIFQRLLFEHMPSADYNFSQPIFHQFQIAIKVLYLNYIMFDIL